MYYKVLQMYYKRPYKALQSTTNLQALATTHDKNLTYVMCLEVFLLIEYHSEAFTGVSQ